MVPIVFVEISLVSPAAAAFAEVEWSIVDATYAASEYHVIKRKRPSALTGVPNLQARFLPKQTRTDKKEHYE